MSKIKHNIQSGTFLCECLLYLGNFSLLCEHGCSYLFKVKIMFLCSQDLSPYLPSVIPGLKTSLLDPVPDVSLVILN